MKRVPVILLLLVALGQLWGCAATLPYGVYEDRRLTDTMANDKSTATSIKTALLQADFGDGWDTAVYCYYGNVFLVGEVPPNMRQKAIDIAGKQKNVRSVTTHWFNAGADAENNFMLRTKLRTNLIGTKGLSSTRVDTEVNAGRVVLLGVVNDEREMNLAIKTAKATAGVKSVKSYLMLPQ